MIVKSFRDLIVWQKAHLLVLEIYSITKNFPSDEKFGIILQLRRAAYSIPANIVEGHARKSKKEFLHFLNISKASLAELRYFLLLSNDLEYITPSIYDSIESKSDEVARILYAFIKKLQNSI